MISKRELTDLQQQVDGCEHHKTADESRMKVHLKSNRDLVADSERKIADSRELLLRLKDTPCRG